MKRETCSFTEKCYIQLMCMNAHIKERESLNQMITRVSIEGALNFSFALFVRGGAQSSNLRDEGEEKGDILSTVAFMAAPGNFRFL